MREDSTEVVYFGFWLWLCLRRESGFKQGQEGPEVWQKWEGEVGASVSTHLQRPEGGLRFGQPKGARSQTQQETTSGLLGRTAQDFIQ